MQKIQIQYFVLALALICAGCGSGAGSAGAPPGGYVDICTNYNGQQITSIETNTWEFSPDGKFIWPEQPGMPFKGTYRVKGKRVLLTFEDFQGKLIKDSWYFDITVTGLERHDRDPESTGEHLVKTH